MSATMIKINVGSPPARLKTFSVDFEDVCKSPVLASLIRNGTIELPNVSVSIFTHVVKHLGGQPVGEHVSFGEAPNPAIRVWVLAADLALPKLQNEMLQLTVLRYLDGGRPSLATLDFVWEEAGGAKGAKLRNFLSNWCKESVSEEQYALWTSKSLLPMELAEDLAKSWAGEGRKLWNLRAFEKWTGHNWVDYLVDESEEAVIAATNRTLRRMQSAQGIDTPTEEFVNLAGKLNLNSNDAKLAADSYENHPYRDANDVSPKDMKYLKEELLSLVDSDDFDCKQRNHWRALIRPDLLDQDTLEARLTALENEYKQKRDKERQMNGGAPKKPVDLESIWKRPPPKLPRWNLPGYAHLQKGKGDDPAFSFPRFPVTSKTAAFPSAPPSADPIPTATASGFTYTRPSANNPYVTTPSPFDTNLANPYHFPPLGNNLSNHTVSAGPGTSNMSTASTNGHSSLSNSSAGTPQPYTHNGGPQHTHNTFPIPDPNTTAFPFQGSNNNNHNLSGADTSTAAGIAPHPVPQVQPFGPDTNTSANMATHTPTPNPFLSTLTNPPYAPFGAPRAPQAQQQQQQQPQPQPQISPYAAKRDCEARREWERHMARRPGLQQQQQQQGPPQGPQQQQQQQQPQAPRAFLFQQQQLQQQLQHLQRQHGDGASVRSSSSVERGVTPVTEGSVAGAAPGSTGKRLRAEARSWDALAGMHL